LLVPLVLSVSGSSAVRHQLAERARAGWMLTTCVVGFLIMIFLSMTTAVDFTEALSGAMDAIMEWFIPFVAVLLVVRSFEQALTLLRVICVCALFVGIAGIIEWRYEHRFFLDLIPASVMADLEAHNPSFKNIVHAIGFRNGQYRASSIFAVSLSFGEFEAMTFPLGVYFAIYGARWRDRALGWIVIPVALFAIWVAGARGGWIAVIVAIAAFTTLWVLRGFKFNKASLAAPSVVVIATVGFTALLLGMIFVTRIHNTILGDGMSQYSDLERKAQWEVGIPKILANPITGHGFNGGSDILLTAGQYNAGTVDSYILSLLIEVGVPGFLFFMGILFCIVWDGTRRFLTDPSRQGALGGAFAASALAFMMDRLVLSQRENHKVFFILAAISVVFSYLETAKAASPLKNPGAAREVPPAFNHRPQHGRA
jgi:O-antigen ligase